MNFKDQINADLAVFFNSQEFSDTAIIDGQSVNVIIDNDRLSTKSADYGGITTGMILYFVPVSSLSHRPAVGDSQTFNNRLYYIDDVYEIDGTYEITLNQNLGE